MVCFLNADHLSLLGDEFNALFDRSLELWKGSFEKSLLKFRQCAQAQVLCDTVGAQQDGGGEVRGFSHVGGDVGALYHTLLHIRPSGLVTSATPFSLLFISNVSLN